VNGRPPIPIGELRFASVSMVRGVRWLSVGTTPARRDGFSVSSAVMRSSDAERAWVRSLLQAMGLPSDPASAQVDVTADWFPSVAGRPVTLEQAMRFTADW